MSAAWAASWRVAPHRVGGLVERHLSDGVAARCPCNPGFVRALRQAGPRTRAGSPAYPAYRHDVAQIGPELGRYWAT